MVYNKSNTQTEYKFLTLYFNSETDGIMYGTHLLGLSKAKSKYFKNKELPYSI